jgi:hypothetical protein
LVSSFFVCARHFRPENDATMSVYNPSSNSLQYDVVPRQACKSYKQKVTRKSVGGNNEIVMKKPKKYEVLSKEISLFISIFLNTILPCRK